jgi:hypothetical protein
MTVQEDHRLSMFEGAEEDIWTEEGKGDWRKLQTEELYHLYSLSNTIQVIKSRRWVGHVAHMVDRRDAHRV